MSEVLRYTCQVAVLAQPIYFAATTLVGVKPRHPNVQPHTKGPVNANVVSATQMGGHWVELLCMQPTSGAQPRTAMTKEFYQPQQSISCKQRTVCTLQRTRLEQQWIPNAGTPTIDSVSTTIPNLLKPGAPTTQ